MLRAWGFAVCKYKLGRGSHYQRYVQFGTRNANNRSSLARTESHRLQNRLGVVLYAMLFLSWCWYAYAILYTSTTPNVYCNAIQYNAMRCLSPSEMHSIRCSPK